MNTILKRAISLMLCFVLAAGYLPVGTFATEEGETVATEATEVTTELNQEPSEENEAPSEPTEAPTDPSETTEPSDEETVPETTVPETTVPEETEPEETEPLVDAWTRYQEALKRHEQLIAELEASHELAMEKEAAAKETEEKETEEAEEELSVFSTFGLQDSCIATMAETNAPIYVLAGGDFQEAGDHSGSAKNVRDILAQISRKYDTMDGFLFAGDYDCETHESDDNGQTAAGITALMGAVQDSYANINNDNSILIQGNHDIMESRIDATGGHDFNGYSVFVMNENDYPDGGGTEAGVTALAKKLETWLHQKLGEGYDSPIFIVSHLPLAFSPRTNVVGDGKYAKLLFDVINSHAEEGLNIIFMHGHNHAYGNDNYLGGEAIYLAKNDKINIAQLGSTTKWTEETLYFTYMNAGYTGYYNDWNYVTTEGTDKLTMTVFVIENDKVTVERYSANGLYNLKSEGRNGRYVRSHEASADSLGLDYNTTVYTSPQTISLRAVEDLGTIGEYVGVEEETIDDVTTSNNGWVEIIAPVPGTEATPESTTYKYVLDDDGVNANTKYLIVNTSSNGDAYVLTNNNNNSVGRTLVNISNGEIIIDDETNVAWTFSGSTSGTVRNQNRYLYPNNGSLNAQTNSSSLTISPQKNGEYQLYRTDTWGRKIFIRYNNGWTGTRVSSYSSTAYSVYLFAYDEPIVTPGTPATPGVNGTYGGILGELTYTATVGMSADDAMALVKAGIDGYYYDAMSTPDSNVTGTKVDDSLLSWEWGDEFDGNTAGDYAVNIYFVYDNGTADDTSDDRKLLLGTAEVIVPATATYYIAEGAGLYIVDMNTSEADALAAVKAGVTVSSATDAYGTNKTAISDDEVTWQWVDRYNGADSGPYTVEILKDGTSLGAVEVKVDIKYETGIESDWTYIGEDEGSGELYTYTLDTNGIDYGSGNKYIIVDDNEAIVLNAQSSSNGTAHAITISGNTATTNTRDYEYHVLDGYRYNYTTAYHLITKGDGTQYLYQESDGIRYGQRSSVKFAVEHMGSGLYRIRDIDGTQWCVVYNGSSWTVANTTNHPERVRFYKYTGTASGTPGGPIYALLEGSTVYTVTQGSSATRAMATVKAGITGYTATDANGTDKTELADSELTWTWKNTFNGNSNGSYWVEITYRDKVLGTVEVRVEPGVINNYPEYPDEGALKVNKTATSIDFQSSGIAQVEVSASGVPMKRGVDVIVMLDTSSSMTSNTITGTNKTRAQVLEESLESLITRLKTPGDDGELLDVRIAIADFNGFYGDNHSESGTPYDRDADDMMSDKITYTANSEAQVYTGTRTLDEGAFIPVEDLASSYTLNYTSGTNYDYAFDAIYQLGTAIKSEDRDLFVIFMSDGAAMQWNYYHAQGRSSLWNNWITGAWTENQLDLNCTTHAYYYDEVDHDGDGMFNEHRMANAVKGDPNKTYEVIRKTNTLGTPTGETNMYMVPGLGATVFSISFDAKADTNVTEASMDKSIASLASDQTGSTQYYYKVTTATELDNAFGAIGSQIAYTASNARFVDQMGGSYSLQMKPSTYNVVNGNTTTSKTLEPKIEIISYDIYTRQDYLNGTITADKIGDRKGTYTILETVRFSADGSKAYSDQIDADGDGIKGWTESTVNNKTVYTYDAGDNILADGTKEDYLQGVIYAKTFLYNTNIYSVEVNGVSIPTGVNADGTTRGNTNVLPSETFYWKLGTVQTSELAMRYYVYLEGAMDGTKEAGSYPTNEFATLYYNNYLGNPCYKDTVSPTMAWKEANIAFAFYLVDENGNIIVNQTTGQTGSFANKIAITNPVKYKTILLNDIENVSLLDVAAASGDVLPSYYKLYDESATYRVTINSNTTGAWEITKGNGKVASTYVTQYKTNDASAYSNALTNNAVGDDYTHTIVWFAVVWSVSAHPDTVVIDYGMPVDISVLTNDMFGEYGKLAGVGAYTDGLENTTAGETMLTGFGNSYNGTYGSAKVDANSGKVRYTPNTGNGMQMQTYEKFAYAVNYKNTGVNADANKNGYYYDTITVIPATTIYYEDSFLKYDNLTWQQKQGGQPWEGDWAVVENPATSIWSPVGTAADAVQEEDRPGRYSLTDANNIYGYDSANKEMSTYSLGSAMRATVDYDNAAQASFTFTGTGFDVISMTDATTGTVMVKVYEVAEDGTLGAKVKDKIVDTYYGYDHGLYNVTYTYTDGEWVKTVGDKVTEENATAKAAEFPEDPAAGTKVTAVEELWVLDPQSDEHIWQVPVMQIEDLTYGRYKVLIQAVYEPAFDQETTNTPETYDFILDAIRIYDPANGGAADNDPDANGKVDTTIEDVYKADGEGWPSYIELRNQLIEAGTLGNADTDTEVIGIVFIDGDGEVYDAKLSDYIGYGPNNEVYLAKGQRVAFILNTPANLANVHIGIKSADGKTATYTITNIAKASNAETGVEAGDYYGAKTRTVSSTTDMYYDLTGWKNDIIVISNTGNRYGTDGIISLTNIKSTYTTDPNGTVTAGEEGPGIPAEGKLGSKTTLYMTPAAAALTLRSLNFANGGTPEEPVPEDTVPEESVPDETVPDETVPEETVPEETVPETTVPGKTEQETTARDEKELIEKEVKKVIQTVVYGMMNELKSLVDKLFR